MLPGNILVSEEGDFDIYTAEAKVSAVGPWTDFGAETRWNSLSQHWGQPASCQSDIQKNESPSIKFISKVLSFIKLT